MSYNTKNYTEQGGEKTIINGEIIINGKLTIHNEAEVEGVQRNPYILPSASLNSLGGIKIAENLPEINAVNINGLKADLNNLLIKLKDAGIMTKDEFNVSVIAIPTLNGTNITTNHSKVESITCDSNIVTIRVAVDELIAFDAGTSGQGIHKWLGLSVATGLNTIIGVVYNGSYSMIQADVTEATGVGCPEGSFVLWIKCDEIIETPKIITLSKPGYETFTLTINVEDI